jgi:hypothetical protein
MQNGLQAIDTLEQETMKELRLEGTAETGHEKR